MGQPKGLVEVLQRGADGAPLLDEAEDESFALSQPLVSIALDDSETRESGTLYITTRRIIWLSDQNDTKGYAVDFLSLSLHAISRDPEAYPLPCIYTQIENGCDEFGEDDEENKASFDVSKVKEMRLIPQDPNTLGNIFEVLCQCALLNPDPEGEKDGEAEWFFNAEEALSGSAEEDADIQVDDPRFQDAEEDGEDGEAPA